MARVERTVELSTADVVLICFALRQTIEMTTTAEPEDTGVEPPSIDKETESALRELWQLMHEADVLTYQRDDYL